MNKFEKLRLTELCNTIWKLLTNDERENYFYDCGTIGFVEAVADMLYLDLEELSDADLDDISAALDSVVAN
jgi:hypothetical protein